MTDRTKTGLEVLQAAFLIGILGNLLLRETPWGLNAFLFVIVFVAAMAMITIRRRPERLTAQNIPLSAGMIFLSAMFLWRDSIELRTIDTIAIVVLMGVLFLPTLKVTAKISGSQTLPPPSASTRSRIASFLSWTESRLLMMPNA